VLLLSAVRSKFWKHEEHGKRIEVGALSSHQKTLPSYSLVKFIKFAAWKLEFTMKHPKVKGESLTRMKGHAGHKIFVIQRFSVSRHFMRAKLKLTKVGLEERGGKIRRRKTAGCLSCVLSISPASWAACFCVEKPFQWRVQKETEVKARRIHSEEAHHNEFPQQQRSRKMPLFFKISETAKTCFCLQGKEKWGYYDCHCLLFQPDGCELFCDVCQYANFLQGRLHTRHFKSPFISLVVYWWPSHIFFVLMNLETLITLL